MKISKEKKEKIFEQILGVLYSNNFKPLFTSEVAREIARDEEFMKGLLTELKNKNLVTEIKRNPKGIIYKRRSRWVLSDGIYQKYKQLSRN